MKICHFQDILRYQKFNWYVTTTGLSRVIHKLLPPDHNRILVLSHLALQDPQKPFVFWYAFTTICQIMSCRPKYYIRSDASNWIIRTPSNH